MADIQKQINSTLSDEEFTNNGKLYKDEPILLTMQQMVSYTPTKYRDMRKIAKGRDKDAHELGAKIFYEQGKFMEDFTDDFDYQGEFAQYFPTYELMTDYQLRGYFSWRTKIRRGVINKAPLSFAFVYIYELINQIGVFSPKEGYYALKNFWMVYKEIDYRISRYVRLWLKDYVVYNKLDKSLLDDFSETNLNDAVVTLLNYKSYRADEVFSAVNSISSYNMENSRLFKQYPEDVKNVVGSVYSALADYYRKNCERPLSEKLLGKFYTSPYFMFSSAVFYDRGCQKSFGNFYIYEINDFCKYTYRKGSWICERFFPYGGKSKQIGQLLKIIDSLMRPKYNFKTAIKAVKSTQSLQRMVDKAICNYREKQKENAIPKIEIDVSKLQDIRKAALETQSKLLVEEFEDVDARNYFGETLDNKTKPENNTGLSDAEYQFMRRLLYDKAYDDLVRPEGLPLSVLVDAINEHFFDRFGDTVIFDVGDQPKVIADYAEELKGIIPE